MAFLCKGMMTPKVHKVISKQNAMLFLCCFVPSVFLIVYFELFWIFLKSWFIPFLGNSIIIVVFVLLLFSCGGCCAVKCLCRIWREKKELDDACYNDLKSIGNADPKMCYHRLKDSGKTNTMLYGRLDIIMNCIDNVSDKKEKLVPSMDDLHEMTMRIELGRTNVVILKTIVSSLLIMGILGTLTGVHSVLSEDKYGLNLTEIAPALMPSAYAVMGMVILIFLQACYMNRLSEYIGRLDEVTIKYFFPLLIQENRLNIDITQENKERLKSLKLRKISKNKYVDKWKFLHQTYELTEQSIKEMKEKKSDMMLINWKLPQFDMVESPSSSFTQSELVHDCVTDTGESNGLKTK